MLLTLTEAATRLGQSVRQVRYLIQTGCLTANKREGRWLIDDASLPSVDRPPAADAARERTDEAFARQVAAATPGKARRGAAPARASRATRPDNAPRAATAADHIADPPPTDGHRADPSPTDAPRADAGRRRFSVADLRAFELARPVHDATLTALGAEHPATSHLRALLEHLTLGCHRFDWSEKALAYRDARDAASRAALALMLSSTTDRAFADPQVEALEQHVIGAIGGLIRRVDRKKLARA